MIACTNSLMGGGGLVYLITMGRCSFWEIVYFPLRKWNNLIISYIHNSKNSAAICCTGGHSFVIQFKSDVKMFDVIIALSSHSLGSGYSTSSTSKIAARQANAIFKCDI